MRPGPGLVVMALAFISGARRGSSTSQKQQQDNNNNNNKHHNQQQHQQTIIPNLYYNIYSNINNNNYININNDNINKNYLNNIKLGKIGYDDDTEDYGGGGGNSALARVNPWLSACDLAQPNQAPDLQGQCTAGTLPVAWVDEGPGPPRCPQSCHKLRLDQNNNINNNNYNNNNNNNNNNNKELSNNKQTNDNKYNNNNNNKNIKTNKNKLNNINNNNNFNTMDNLHDVRQQDTTQHQYNQQKQYKQKHQQKQQQYEQQQKNEHLQQQQQCLDYLGDNEESSPAQLCKKSRRELATKLRSLRLKHCCERTVFSALHTLALNHTLNGGNECIGTLNDLLDMDALATRITCEFTEILVRYDCRQRFSLIHHCRHCKEAYRRWVCSTLIPYFAEPDDIRQNTTTSNTINKNNNNSINNKTGLNNSTNTTNSNLYHERTSRSARTSDKSSNNNNNNNKYNNNIDNNNNNINNNNINNNNMNENSDEDNDSNNNRKDSGTSDKSQIISTAIANPIVADPLIDRILQRSKRKSEIKRRRKIRPCLSVCQSVEQKCPYMLPGDRAPAYPTQYAGEPTFLCLDPNIPETGEQLRKSNNGPDNCCYRYCGTPNEGICAYCEDLTNSNQNNSNLTNSISTTDNSIDNSLTTSIIDLHRRIVEVDNIYYYDDYDDIPPEIPTNCQNFQGTTVISSQRCTIPYYASSTNKLISILLSYRYLIIWTILWCLVNNVITISNWTKNLLLTPDVRL